jgi:hypothetical protein
LFGVEGSELVATVESTISTLEGTVSAICSQLREGSTALENARRTVSAKAAVASFFDNLYVGNIAAAFARVSDDVKWWVPGGIRLKMDKPQMMKRMGLANAIKCEIMEAVLGESCIAVRVSLGGKSYQFMFLFGGDQIVGVRETLDVAPLTELVKRK